MDISDMETGRYTLRQSMLRWKIVKMLVRIAATCLSFTALIEKYARIDTTQQQQIFLMTDISSCLQNRMAFDRMDRDLMIPFLEPSGAVKSAETFDMLSCDCNSLI